MTDLRQRIAETLQNHSMLDYGRKCSCGDWHTAGPNGCYEEHVADVLLAVLQPDTDTIAKVIAKKHDLMWHALTEGGREHCRDVARAAINAWTQQ